MDHGQGHTIYVHVEGVPRDIPKVSSHSCEQFVYITTLAVGCYCPENWPRRRLAGSLSRSHSHFTCIYVSIPRIAYAAHMVLAAGRQR